jgi:hypothetical protein
MTTIEQALAAAGLDREGLGRHVRADWLPPCWNWSTTRKTPGQLRGKRSPDRTARSSGKPTAGSAR